MFRYAVQLWNKEEDSTIFIRVNLSEMVVPKMRKWLIKGGIPFIQDSSIRSRCKRGFE
jgi:hypothetical protein